MFATEKVEKASSQMEYERIFALIDNLLSFEACLYHQILPLSIEGSLLRLGVVDLQDASGSDYARRMLAYLNCSLVTEEISCETQRSVLSAYLYHKGQKKSVPINCDRETQISNPQSAKEENQLSPTTRKIGKESTQELLSTPMPVKSGELLGPKVAENQEQNITKSQNFKQRESISRATPTNLKHKVGEVSEQPVENSSPELEVQAFHLSGPVEVLTTLDPKQLLHELLARILLKGIGRLYFERQESGGRILCSQDGVLQSVVESLESRKFESVINELKLLTKMPLTPLEKPRQVEIERIYQQNNLLLRLRVMPGNYGEEATMQVLRGEALRFYQQQQLSNWSREALSLAQQLQGKMARIRDRSRIVPMKLELLPAIDKLLKNVEQQIEAMIADDDDKL